MLFLFSTVGHAAGNKIIQVSMNGGNVPVTQVPIIKDGKVIDMETPSFVYVDRTLVPLRFVAESFGAKVDWDQKAKTATVLHGDKKIDLTINSEIAILNNEKKPLDKNSIPKLVTFSNDDTRTMVPLAFMSEVLGYEVGWDDVVKAAYINSKVEENPESQPKPDRPKEEPEIDLTNKVMDIKHESVDGKEAIVIYGTKEVKLNTIKFKEPERISIDLMDSTLQGSTFYNYDYNLGFIKGVRASQFSPDNNYKPDDKIVRVVLDIKDGIYSPDVKIDKYDNKIVIFPEKSFWENMTYNVDGKDRTITIDSLTDTNYSVNYDVLTKSMEINIPKDNVELLTGVASISDGLVEDFKVVEESGNMKVVIQFKKSIEYTILSNAIDNKVMVRVKRDSDLKPSDRVIVVDAGHGGTDPGAISSNKTKEKDVNLQISLKTEKALKDAGYNVLMTRDTDKTLGLYERPAFANNNFADLFISIHSNSTENKDVHGIEVLYAPAAAGSEKEEGQQILTKAIMDELLKATGAKKRGIIERPKLVVIRESKMPAVLIEVGFLSNAKEEKLITDDAYQNKIVEAILRGIEIYFETY
jgi:N-acetylmuramoyl-L-alanine amidase